MKRAALLPILAVALAMTSACSQRETPKTVSDYCLNDEIVDFSIAPKEGADDPGNRFDTKETVNTLLSHNAIHRRLCGNR